MPMKCSDKIDTQAARTRLKYELSLSRSMLAESGDVVPRFILELPDFKHMVILTNMPASGPKRDAALKLIANILGPVVRVYT